VKCFPNLKCLILINTGLKWKSFFKVVAAFMEVYEFILCKNDLSDVENILGEKLKYMQEARFINLEETNQHTFDPLRVFSSLPQLDKLILNNNPLSELGKNITGFTELKHLSVQSCKFF
jgi:Leucine-rich repeat (LRR) protein